MYVNFNAGIYIEEKTKYLPYVTLLGAAINVVANIVLIPYFSLTGAAYATLFSYLSMCVSLYFVSQKFYKINYELGKVLKIIGLILVTSVVYYYFYYNNLLTYLNKFILLFAFFAMLFVLRVINKSDMQVAKRVVLRRR